MPRGVILTSIFAVGLAAILTVGLAAPASADFEDGKRAAIEGDYATAYQEWRPLAEQGHADAQFLLGLMYREGRAVPQDFAKAAEWLQKASGQGHVDAGFFLARAYREGRGVAQDYGQAAHWFRAAAELGHAEAAFTLGLMHRKGEGVAKDDAEAASWYRRAAELGHGEARFTLGAVTEEGRGVERDSVRAYAWYSLAEDSGVPLGGVLRQRLARRMTPEQIAEARRLAEEWRAGPKASPAQDKDKERAPAEPSAPSEAVTAAAEDEPEPARPAEAAGDWRVRLASYRAPEGPNRGWDLLSKAHPGLLDELKPSVRRVDIPGKGVFFRLEAGPLRDRAAASALCAALKRRALDCVVVEP